MLRLDDMAVDNNAAQVVAKVAESNAATVELSDSFTVLGWHVMESNLVRARQT